MNLIKKFEQIIKFQNNNSDEILKILNKPILQQEILEIEKLLGEKLNEEVLKLYHFANGQSDDNNGIFFGEKFITSEEIINQLTINRSLVKPENKIIPNKELSNSFLKKIVALYLDNIPKRKLFIFKKSWFKIEFKCGLNSCSGLYLYPNENTSVSEREIFKIDNERFENILKTTSQLHELEKETYNWVELEFIVYSEEKFEVKRTFYDFDNQITFTSKPDNAIKKKYLHYKWLPLFSDYGGNFIGVDYDPDTQGKKGQIIIFGRDEENMIVLADSLDHFFDFILLEINKPNNKLMNLKYHLHDTLIELNTAK